MANEFTEMGQALDAAVASRAPESAGGTATSENQSQETNVTETDTGTPRADGRGVRGVQAEIAPSSPTPKGRARTSGQ